MRGRNPKSIHHISTSPSLMYVNFFHIQPHARWRLHQKKLWRIVAGKVCRTHAYCTILVPNRNLVHGAYRVSMHRTNLCTRHADIVSTWYQYGSSSEIANLMHENTSISLSSPYSEIQSREVSPFYIDYYNVINSQIFHFSFVDVFSSL